MSASRLKYLLHVYATRQCTEMEYDELMQLLTQKGNEEICKQYIVTYLSNIDEHEEIKLDDQIAAKMLEDILSSENKTTKNERIKPAKYFNWRRLFAAAALIIIIGAGYYLIPYFSGSTPTPAAPEMITSSIVPGSKKATLTISGGASILLDDAQNGEIARQGNTIIKKTDDALQYENNTNQQEAVYHTLTTPRGGTYQLNLPDGTKVWLNSASSLHYPSSFSGNFREVKLKGEAYFEVSSNKKMPFLVKVNDVQVEVLGTRFNVNAYNDSQLIKTSLVEGSVKVAKNKQFKILKPGQEAVIDQAVQNIKVHQSDIEEAIAWKNGLFYFSGDNIQEIMMQISRWYDVEVVFDGNVSQRSFEGKISRYAQLSEVMEILKLSNIKFSIEGKKITIH
jgi:transmembrane sensor